MVTGLNVFRDYFADDTDKYVLIGGAACDIVFTRGIRISCFFRDVRCQSQEYRLNRKN